MDYLFALGEALNKDPSIRSQIRYYPNSSLYVAAGRYRYAEARIQGRLRSYHLVAVEPTDYLTTTLEKAASGACLSELAHALVDAYPDVAREDAQAYLNELVETQMLVSSLTPCVTGEEAVHPMIAEVESLSGVGHISEPLKKARDALASLDSDGVGRPVETYREIAKGLDTLPIPTELSRLFQVDMIKPMEFGQLGSSVALEIVRGLRALYSIAYSPSPSSAIDEFRDALVQRYGDQWVPLLEALDEESGIGFQRSRDPRLEDAPLLHGLNMPGAGGRTISAAVRWTRRDQFLLERTMDAAAARTSVVQLTDDDLAQIRPGDSAPRPLPDAFVVAADIAATSCAGADQGDFKVWLRVANGPSGARMLGRFCHAERALEAEVRSHLMEEESRRPEAVFAEIVHLPEGRLGNVISRPVLRKYEIPYLGVSGARRDEQIPLTDLQVAVRGDRVLLRSVKLAREVIPRLSTAHNFARGQGVYRFLCHLQGQHVTEALGWTWGPISGLPFLPRVQYGRIVLSRATWRIPQAVLKPIRELEGFDRFQAVQFMRRDRALPRKVVLVEGDNELMVDFDNPLSLDAFVNETAGQSDVRLAEIFPAEDELMLEGPEGRFFHQLLLPVVMKPREERSAMSSRVDPRFSASVGTGRQFTPGSDWLYFKLYTGTSTADVVLRRLVAPVVTHSLSEGWIDRWFFVRYNDPDHHLRVRFHGNPATLVSRVLPMVSKYINQMNRGAIWRVQLDTYEPEWERYGGTAGVELSEHLFWADSEAVLEILSGLETGAPNELERWCIALLGVDRMLDDVGLDLEAKRRFAEETSQLYAREFGMNTKNGRRQLSERYRAVRPTLDSLHSEARSSCVLAPFARRSERVALSVQSLRAAADTLQVEWSDLVRSHVHMSVNRLLRAGQRMQEFVIYDFLARRYRSAAARLSD
jgi:thiopeptide-type bacteriocin biosynthesis protein